MSNSERRALRDKLDAFSRRLDARVREFKDRGEFSDTHDAFTETIRKRQASIKEKLESAIGRDATLDIIKYEFERDFNALSEEFGRWEKRLDTETAKLKGRSTS